ncbi:TIGR01212 family radical SAM protein [Campylobacterota bacterium]|nr:TIGR01212 family radical SAM protein [Campylobacterota bacterium]
MRILPTFGRYLRGEFGCAVRKIPLSVSSFTCPNIDGKLSRGGCSYCANESFSPNLDLSIASGGIGEGEIEAQIEGVLRQYRESEELFKRRGVKRFLAYFQSFSNTYCEIEPLRRLHNAVLAKRSCVGLSIGTRADCIDEKMLDYLIELDQKTHLWVEIGIQSSHNETLKKINRQESYDAIAQKITMLRSRGIRVCAHLIFGLPDETNDMILQTVDRVAKLNINAVKIHPLYIVKNTAMAKQNHKPIELENYLYLLKEAIAILPKDIIYQRVSAGVENDTLIAPKWCANKNAQMSAIRKALLSNKIIY